jgi:ComF family protein
MIFDLLIDSLFPSRCLNCEKKIPSGETICEICLGKIHFNRTLFCAKCGARLPANKKICHPAFPYILGAAADYENEPVKNLIHGLKFRFIRRAAEPLAKFLIQYIEELSLAVSPFIIIPIPLGKKRERERGFNQSQLIAELVAKHFSLPLIENNLVRKKNTNPQSKLPLEKRLANIKDCFSLKNPGEVAAKNILLIDDVVTSGATMREAALTLKAAGARKIIALAAAKA